MSSSTSVAQPGLAAAVGSLRAKGLRASLSSVRQNLAARWYLRSTTMLGIVRLDGRAAVTNKGIITIHDRVRLAGGTVRLELVCHEGAEISIGFRTFINYGTNISAMNAVHVGQDCDIGQYCIIMDSDYHDVDDHHRPGKSAPILIDDDVWLGARTIVLRGAHIGRGAVVGANSVVTGDVPPFTFAAGNPARVVRAIGKNRD